MIFGRHPEHFAAVKQITTPLGRDAIFKTSDEMVFSNYRPVSVLPVFSKLLERLVYNRLIAYITNNKLLYEYHFGFQKGKSTHLALILLVDKITGPWRMCYRYLFRLF